MSGNYDPRSAAFALRNTIKRHTPRIVSSNVPGLVDERGETITPTPQPAPIEGLCVLIRSIEDGSTALPPDFADVVMSKDGLSGHVRPDGGICLGFFGNSREGAVVVYGDPMLPPDQTKQIVVSFWEQAKIGPFGPFSRPTLEVVR